MAHLYQCTSTWSSCQTRFNQIQINTYTMAKENEEKRKGLSQILDDSITEGRELVRGGKEKIRNASGNKTGTG
ncbi:hypothetical protein SuUB63_21670 [Streptococcus uberis]